MFGVIWQRFGRSCKILNNMKKLKTTLYGMTITALLCWDLLYIISGIIELDYVFTMAPYMLTGDCCRYIDFMGTSIRTIFYVGFVSLIMCITASSVFMSIYSLIKHRYKKSLVLSLLPLIIMLGLLLFDTILS